jgi:hypothetical protein
MGASRQAIKNYFIALLVFVALVCAFAGGIGFYIAGFLLLAAIERFFVWGWAEGAKDMKSPERPC